jgi:hypothetical protein
LVVEFSKDFLKELKKHVTKAHAVTLVKKLAKTTPSDGDYVALIANVIIREKRDGTFRFYFIVQNNLKHVITKAELNDMLVKCVALSKKNNQQDVIDKLKADLQKFGFKL